jgi:hypothetical protein
MKTNLESRDRQVLMERAREKRRRREARKGSSRQPRNLSGSVFAWGSYLMGAVVLVVGTVLCWARIRRSRAE